MCASNYFPDLRWSWDQSKGHVHVYCKILWEHKYKPKYTQICNYFISKLYSLLFEDQAPCITEQAQALIGSLGNWYFTHGSSET